MTARDQPRATTQEAAEGSTAGQERPRRGKYGVRLDAAGVAARTVNGITFASKAESERYQTLVIHERAGEIRHIQLQPSYPLVVDGTRIATYRADFSYINTATDEEIIEDVKGVRTPVYMIKKRLMKALYGIEIQEVE